MLRLSRRVEASGAPRCTTRKEEKTRAETCEVVVSVGTKRASTDGRDVDGGPGRETDEVELLAMALKSMAARTTRLGILEMMMMRSCGGKEKGNLRNHNQISNLRTDAPR